MLSESESIHTPDFKKRPQTLEEFEQRKSELETAIENMRNISIPALRDEYESGNLSGPDLAYVYEQLYGLEKELSNITNVIYQTKKALRDYMMNRKR